MVMIHSNSIANESDRTVIKVRLHKKISIKDVFTKCDQIPKETTDLVTFTEKIINGKLHFSSSNNYFAKYLVVPLVPF